MTELPSSHLLARPQEHDAGQDLGLAPSVEQ